jgi:flavodoxin
LTVKAIVVYYTYTRFENTRKAAEAIRNGIKEGGIEAVECKNIKDVKPEELTQYDVIVFGTPTHHEGVANKMRVFMESLRQVDLRGKNSAAFDTRYEGEKIGGLEELEKYMNEFGMNIIMQGLPVLLRAGEAWGPLRDSEPRKCKEFGKAIAQKISGKTFESLF